MRISEGGFRKAEVGRRKSEFGLHSPEKPLPLNLNLNLTLSLFLACAQRRPLVLNLNLYLSLILESLVHHLHGMEGVTVGAVLDMMAAGGAGCRDHSGLRR